jgi:transposase-like protein
MMLSEVFMVRKRPTYPPEFKAEAVRLAHVGDKSVSQVAQALGVSETTLREWMERAERSKAAVAPAGPLSAEERQELQRLRRENARLQMERDFLKKAAAFFAKEQG